MNQVSAAAPALDCLHRAWNTHEAELLAFLVQRSGDRDAAEDLLQEIFLKSMLQGKRFCAIEHPRAWLFAVARHALIDHLRLKKPLEPLPDELPVPEHEARSPVDELDGCLRRNLAELPFDVREVIEKCDLEGMTVRNYATLCGLTLPAAKSRLLRARQRLRKALVENCQVRFDETGQVCCHAPRDRT